MTISGNAVPQQRRPRDTRPMTLHRLIERTSIDDVYDYLTESCLELSPELEPIQLAGTRAVLFWASYAKAAPDWVNDLTALTGVRVGPNHLATGLGAVLFTEVDNRIYAATFGQGYTWIDDAVKDRSFGLALAVRCLDPADISDVVRLVPGMHGRVDSTMVPGGSPLWNMRIDQITQMVRKIKGGTIDLDLTYSRGGARMPKLESAGSLHTHFAITPGGLVADLRTIEEALRTRPVHRDLQFIENIVPVHSPALRDELDDRLDASLGEEAATLALAVPVEYLSNYADARCFQLRVRGARMSPKGHLTVDDIVLLARRQKRGERVAALRDGTVSLYASLDTSDRIGDSRLWRWLEASVSIGARRFTLLDALWYELDAAYLTALDQDIRGIFDSGTTSLPLPPWHLAGDKFETEREYNIRVGDICPDDFVTMDRRFVQTRTDRRSDIEICDLLGPLDELVHVKPADGSDVLSHLFYQGLVSAENLARANVRQQFCDNVARWGHGRTVPPDFTPSKVVYAIMLKNGRTLTPDTLYPFAQVTLRHAASELKNRGISVGIVGIPLEKRSHSELQS